MAGRATWSDTALAYLVLLVGAASAAWFHFRGWRRWRSLVVAWAILFLVVSLQDFTTESPWRYGITRALSLALFGALLLRQMPAERLRPLTQVRTPLPGLRGLLILQLVAAGVAVVAAVARVLIPAIALTGVAYGLVAYEALSRLGYWNRQRRDRPV